MTNKKKIIALSCIIVLFFAIVIYNSSLNFNKKVYVLSDKESTNNNYNDNIENEEEKSSTVEKIKEENSIKKIYISGAVRTPGVVSIGDNDRLIDAIEKVGGFIDEADLNRINLAMIVEDGSHYIIPKIGEEIESSTSVNNLNQNSGSLNTNNKVNINTADLTLLDTLPGVGPSTAQKIVDYREQNGKFETIDDIKNIKGIGDKKFEEIQEHICVK